MNDFSNSLSSRSYCWCQPAINGEGMHAAATRYCIRRDGALCNGVSTQHTHPNSKSQIEEMIARGRGLASVFGVLGVDEGIFYLGWGLGCCYCVVRTAELPWPMHLSTYMYAETRPKQEKQHNDTTQRRIMSKGMKVSDSEYALSFSKNFFVSFALGVGLLHKQNCASSVCWSHQSATNGRRSISTRDRARRRWVFGRNTSNSNALADQLSSDPARCGVRVCRWWIEMNKNNTYNTKTTQRQWSEEGWHNRRVTNRLGWIMTKENWLNFVGKCHGQ
jgi:hypothetical protein